MKRSLLSVVLIIFFFAEYFAPACGSAREIGRHSGGYELTSLAKFPVLFSDSSSLIESIKILTENGGRVDWSPTMNLIAFDQRGTDGFYDVYTMNPDGSNEKCITCENRRLPNKNKGNPAWHPSGKYIVFQAEKRFQVFPSYYAEPGRGFNNDLWLITSDGNRTYKLHTVKRRMGVLHPHFSYDGSKLFWAEKTGNNTWALKLADFVDDTGDPRLENIETFTPGAGLFYESHDFSKDGKKLLFSGNLEGQAMSGLDIYTLDIKTQELENLTSSPQEWDEHAHFTSSGKKIAWMSSKGCKCNPGNLSELKTDIWMMNADGSQKVRMTYFNEPGHPEYTGERIVVGDMSWSPNGLNLVVYLILPGSGTAEIKGAIALITFREPQ